MVDLGATGDTIAIARNAGTPFLCVNNDAAKVRRSFSVKQSDEREGLTVERAWENDHEPRIRAPDWCILVGCSCPQH
jgi:hypothetical protein